MNYSSPQSNSDQNLPGLFEQFRPRLKLLVEMRMDRRVRARIDPSDIIQEAYTEALRRFSTYQQDARMTPYVWLRFLTLQQLLIAHRHHLGVKARTAIAERPLHTGGGPGLESESIAAFLAGSESSPSVKASREEENARLTATIEEMDELDREVLVLKHFEQLSHAEIGQILNLTSAAVSSRYRRALKKLGESIVEKKFQ